MILSPLPHSSPRRHPVYLAFLAVAVAALSACGVHGLSFKADNRLEIVRPKDRDEVQLPLTIEWQLKGDSVGPGRGSFGLVLDQAPPRTGETLAWLFRGDRSCRGDTGKAYCQTPEFLATRRVYDTTKPRFTIDILPQLSGNDRRRQFHEFTIVLLDAHGRRVGEGAWSVQFQVPRGR